MALEPMTTHITTAKSADDVRSALVVALESLGATVTADGDALEATSGKKMGTRLLGAMFVPDHWLPLHHTITFAPDGSDTRVEITVNDDFGMGLRSGFAKKYAAFMQKRLGELTAAAG
jgi:hypothetical protein